MSNQVQMQGPLFGFIKNNRYTQKGFRKDDLVVILFAGDTSYGKSAKALSLKNLWWKNENQTHWIKASGIELVRGFDNKAMELVPLETALETGIRPMLMDGDMLKRIVKKHSNWSEHDILKFLTDDRFQSMADLTACLISLGVMKDKTKEDAQVKFYGQVVRNTDKALLVSVGPDKEEHWFPKSQTEVVGYLTDRPDQYVLTTKAWQLKSKVGDGLCETFRKAQKAIDKHGTMRNPMGVGEDGEIKSPGLGI